MATDPFAGQSQVTPPTPGRTVVHAGGQVFPGAGPRNPNLPVYGRIGPGRSANPLTKNTVVSGLVTGFRDVPLLGWAFEKALTESQLVDKRTLNRMARVANSSTIGKGARLAGAFIPQLLLAPKLYSAAGALGTRLLGNAAPLAARVLGPGRLPSALEKVASWSLDTGGLGTLGKPALARAGEIVAGNAAIGGVMGADALLKGEPAGEALRAAGLGAAIGMAADTGLTVGAKLLFPGARSQDVREIVRRASAPMAKTREQAMAVLDGEIVKVADRLARAQSPESAMALSSLRSSLDTAKTRIGNLDVQGAKQAIQAFYDEPAFAASYIRSEPKEYLGLLDDVGLQFWKTADQASKELGVTGAKTMALVQDYIATHRVADNLDHHELVGMGRKLAGAFGRKTKDGWSYAAPLIGVYEREGIEAAVKAAPAVVGPVKNPELLRSALTEIDTFISTHRAAVERMGGTLPMVENGKFFPKLIQTEVPRKGILGKAGLLESPEAVADRLEKSLVNIGKSESDAKRLVKQLIFKERAVFKSPDILARELGLTYDEAVEAGIPLIPDPVAGLQVWAQAINRKVSFEARFGRNGNLINKVIRPAVQAEGGSAELFDLVMNSVTGHNYGSVMSRAAAEGITNLQVASRMGTSVLQNMTQPINAITQMGHTANAAGLGYFLSKTKPGKLLGVRPDPNVDAAMEGLALGDSVLQSWREVALDQVGRTPLGAVADWVLTKTGFTRVEAFNRVTSAAAAMHDVSKTLVRGIAGTLRGNNLDIARRRTAAYGIDLDALIAEGRGLSDDAAAAAHKMLTTDNYALLKKVGWGGARSTQFIPDPTRRPLMWNTPLGRVLTQFKSFALSQSRFLRDRVINEAAQGNYRPLANYAMWAPVAGEFTTAMRGALLDGKAFGEDRPRNGLERAVEDLMYVGGFGLGTELYRAAQFGPGSVLKSLAGPTGAQFADVVGYIASGEHDRLVDGFGRLGTVKAVSNMLGYGMGQVDDATRATAERRSLEHWLAGTRRSTRRTAVTMRELMQDELGI